MTAGKKLVEGNEIAIAFSHLLALDGNHVVVHPVVHELVPHSGFCLGYLALVVGEYEVHATSVYVERLSQILTPHGGALAVPAGESFAPRAGPVHQVLRLGTLPESKIQGVAFFVLPIQRAGVGEHVFDVASAELSVPFFSVKLLYVEVDRALALVGISGFEDLLYQSDLFDDMPTCHWLNTWGEHIESLHGMAVASKVKLHHLHRLKLL